MAEPPFMRSTLEVADVDLSGFTFRDLSDGRLALVFDAITMPDGSRVRPRLVISRHDADAIGNALKLVAAAVPTSTASN